VRKGRRLAALALLLAAPAVAAGWARITAPLALVFPRDHGAHPDVRTEWWYTTGNVSDAGGRRFGFELAFFRRGLDPTPPAPGSSSLRARQILAAHLAVADVARGGLRFAERVRRLDGLLAGAATEDLDVVIEDWAMRRLASGAIELGAEDRASGTALSLSLEPQTPLVLEGNGGLSRKGPEPGNASAYVSYPRMAVRGRLTVDGRPHVVEGEAWFDHEWGTTGLAPGVVGWDWLGLRLADGREVMLYRMRRGDGSAAPESAGTLIGRDGASRQLTSAEFTVEPLAFWTSPRTRSRYPSLLRVLVPSAGLDLEVRPMISDAEIDARASTGTVYWEGPVTASGTVTGEGYLELTGYAGSLSGLF
jgi:predicted secreted hydrolase